MCSKTSEGLHRTPAVWETGMGVDKCGLVTEESRSVLNVLLLGDLQLKP